MGLSDTVMTAARRTVRRLCAMALLTALTGCIALPIMDPEPFPDEVTKAITPGSSTRREVLAAFGKPDGISRDQSTFVYSEQQDLALVIWGAGYSGGMSKEGPDFHYILNFAPSGKVRDARVVKDIKSYCRSDGACLFDASFPDLWAAPKAEQAAAKKLRPVPGECAVYLIREDTMREYYGSDAYNDIQIDGDKIVYFPDGPNTPARFQYYYLVMQPGQHRLDHVGATGPKHQPRPYTFQCAAGDVLMIKRTQQGLETTKGLFGPLPVSWTISFTTYDSGWSRLMISQFGRMLAL